MPRGVTPTNITKEITIKTLPRELEAISLSVLTEPFPAAALTELFSAAALTESFHILRNTLDMPSVTKSTIPITKKISAILRRNSKST